MGRPVAPSFSIADHPYPKHPYGQRKSLHILFDVGRFGLPTQYFGLYPPTCITLPT